MPKIDFIDELKIGFLQTNVNNDVAWGLEKNITLNMKQEAEFQVWQEIQKGFHKLYNHNMKPDIIVLPELTIPLGYEFKLRKLAQEINSVVFAGLDFVLKSKTVENKAMLIVPNKWRSGMDSFSTNIRHLGKQYPAHVEEKTIRNYNKQEKKNISFLPDRNIYLIDGGDVGSIGFAICSDFYDLQRYVAYKGRVQHIIILAYNQDTNSFFALAEAIARLVMCNVVICNTGHFGDSLAFSPYRKSHKRMIFRNQGADLFATQVVQLPVKFLVKDQKSDSLADKVFKFPPGYQFRPLG